jgi:hypothetical protein
VWNVEHGRFERALSGLTAAAALVTGAEIFLEHDRASFGNKMMWWPVALTPIATAAGLAGVGSKRMAKTFLPLASAAVVANGLQGTWLHRAASPRSQAACGCCATTWRWARRCSPRGW